MLWLLLYGILYVDLHLNISALEEVNCTETAKQTPAVNPSNATAPHCGKSVQGE
ncbi:unnamed protein product [Allacma fusca]|uniref:Uncharacterized protein n=1 Tax=Allacma fusca TaxID=39272 RepID=A0A8J2K3Z6_9HEXA|nr:unnamed protein product [Allacma fusca]